MKYITLSFLLASCANVQHLTNTNLREVQGLSTNASLRQKYNSIKELTPAEAGKCKSKGKINAKDNGFDQGESYAVLYLKGSALELGADSVVVEKKEKVGDYGWVAQGEAFLCAPVIAPTKEN